MPQKLPIDLICFDLDGTLTNSIPPAIDAIQQMLIELKFPSKSKEEIHKYVGFGEVPLIEGSIGTSDPDLIKKALSVYERIYTENGLLKIPLYPNVREFLELYKNKLMVIVSNKRDSFIRIILKNLKIDGFFKEVIGGDTAASLKPDPCAIINIINKYSIDRSKAIFIGDMTVDIETGKNAGMHTAAVTYGFDSKGKLEAASADFLVDDIMQLSRVIV